MKIVEIKAEHSYNVYISTSISGFSKQLNSDIKDRKVCIISDEKVATLHFQNFISNIENKRIYSFIVKRGENSKSLYNFKNIQNYLIENEFTRSDLIIALGGGVVGDLAAFVASTYMRGIKLISIPTTLLSMIDSSVGGKTAINMGGYKNVVGSFYSPHSVFISTEYLKTLSRDEYDNGMGELVKYMILSKTIYDFIIEQDKIDDNMEELIKLCIEYKGYIVENDFKESGLRMLLNLGHTIGHSIETQSNFKVKHGIAVRYGIDLELEISKSFYKKDSREFINICNIQSNLEKAYKFKKIKFNKSSLFDNIKHDKKMLNNDTINIVHVENIGRCKIQKMKLDKIRRILNA